MRNSTSFHFLFGNVNLQTRTKACMYSKKIQVDCRIFHDIPLENVDTCNSKYNIFSYTCMLITVLFRLTLKNYAIKARLSQRF